MKAIEFESKINGTSLQFPESILPDLKPMLNRKVRVIVLFDEATEYQNEAEFKTLAAEEFVKGYSKVDEIYDKEFGDE